MKRHIFISIGLIVVVMTFLAGCGSNNDSSVGNEPQMIKKLVNDYSTRTLTADNVSITSEQLMVKDGKSSQTYNLPEDEFFVSIAPYVHQTHPCAYHNLTSCQGEMVNEEFEVYIEDDEGNVIVDEMMTTLSNGFLDFWLPRDKTYQITLTNGGKSTQAKFSTFLNDYTCITTIQLT